MLENKDPGRLWMIYGAGSGITAILLTILRASATLWKLYGAALAIGAVLLGVYVGIQGEMRVRNK